MRNMYSCSASQHRRTDSRVIDWIRRSSSTSKCTPSSTWRRQASIHCSAACSIAASAVSTFPRAWPYQRW